MHALEITARRHREAALLLVIRSQCLRLLEQLEQRIAIQEIGAGRLRMIDHLEPGHCRFIAPLVSSHGEKHEQDSEYAARESAQRIHLAGDYFGGPSTNTSLSSGELAANRLAAYLGSA